MAEPAKRNATFQDLEDLPPDLVGEIIFGSLYTQPRPAPPHVTAGTALQIELGSPFQKGRGGPGGWIFVAEPELRLGPHAVSPDIAGWRRERLPHLPETAYYDVVPDWVCEILSPSTAVTDRGPKRRIYATYSVQHLWHLDPIAKLLEVFELKQDHWVLFEAFQDGDTVKAPPFDAVPFQLTDLWPLPPAPQSAT